jgi:hypothetical protein
VAGKHQKEARIDTSLAFVPFWELLSVKERREPWAITMRLYELARRHAREKRFPNWRQHRPGPEVALEDSPRWDQLTPEDQATISSILNPASPPAAFFCRSGEAEIMCVALGVDIEDYPGVGELHVYRKGTNHELSKTIIDGVRVVVPAPTYRPIAGQKKTKQKRKTDRLRAAGKTNDPSWRGLAIWDIQFYRIRPLERAEKKLLTRMRKEAALCYEKLRFAMVEQPQF